MLLKGLKFGMLIQLAVGPVCLYVLSTAINTGFFNALPAVAAVAIVDALYITLAVLGAGRLLKKRGWYSLFKTSGAVVIFLFAINIISGSLGINIVQGPVLSIPAGKGSSFVNAFLLTASSPVTIIFWSGVFSAKIAGEHMERADLFFFAAGCVLSTLLFLSLVSLAGSVSGRYIPGGMVRVLNGIVGILLVFYSVKMFTKKPAHVNE